MPSIRALFADPDLMDEGEDAEIDIDKVLDSVTEVLNDRANAPGQESGDPETPLTGEVQAPAPQTPTASDAVDGAEGEVEEPEGEDGLPPAPPPAARDPFSELPADRRAAILALDEALRSDPSKRDAIFGIMAGSAPAPQVEVPRMPEEIEPGSAEALLWEQQQRTDATLHEIRTAQRDQQLAFETQRANTAAVQACQSFGERYNGKLEQSDVIEIAKYAGQSGISSAFLNTPDGQRDPAMAYNQALEHVLWTNEAFRTRVLGTGEDETPPGEQPAATDRKRKLHALSPAASPVSGPAPSRTPLETGQDGRLTEKSRQSLVKELATDMARRSQGA